MSLHHHAEGVANQNDVDPGLVQHPGKTCIVSGETGDLVALRFHFGKCVGGDALTHCLAPSSLNGRALLQM